MCTDIWIPAFSGEKTFLRLDADEQVASGERRCAVFLARAEVAGRGDHPSSFSVCSFIQSCAL